MEVSATGGVTIRKEILLKLKDAFNSTTRTKQLGHILWMVWIKRYVRIDITLSVYFLKFLCNSFFKQECIPVGCVPSATVAVCWGRGGEIIPVGCILPTCPLYWGVSPNRDPLSTRRPPHQKALPEGHNRRSHQKAITEDHFQPEDHTRRPPSNKRPPNQKAIPEGHTRRP